MDFKTLLPFITFLLGILFNELSFYLRGKRESKKLINQAVYAILDLIFINKQFQSTVDVFFKASSERTPLSKSLLFNLVEDKTLNTKEFETKLNNAVLVISQADPFLAQEVGALLRSSISCFQDFSKPDPDNFEKINFEMYNEILRIFNQSLEDSLLKLARTYSWLYWYRIKKEFEKKGLKPNKSWLELVQSINKDKNE